MRGDILALLLSKLEARNKVLFSCGFTTLVLFNITDFEKFLNLVTDLDNAKNISRIIYKCGIVIGGVAVISSIAICVISMLVKVAKTVKNSRGI